MHFICKHKDGNPQTCYNPLVIMLTTFTKKFNYNVFWWGSTGDRTQALRLPNYNILIGFFLLWILLRTK